MPISNKCIITQANACLANNPTELNLTQVSAIKTSNTVYSVANTSVLPVASCNKGRWIFVEDISAYRYSNGTEWTNDYDTTASIVTGAIVAIGCECFFSFMGNGILPNNTSTYVSVPTGTGATEQWVDVSSGSEGAPTRGAIKADGTLWFWGYGNEGSMWQNNTTYPSSPVQEITSGTNWIKVAGSRNSAAIKATGELFSAGRNFVGGVGINSTTNTKYSSPVQEITSSSWCEVKTGYDNTYGVKTDGSLWGWGCGVDGNLGNLSTIDRSSPVQEITSSTWCVIGESNNDRAISAIKTDGTLWTWGCFCEGADATSTVSCNFASSSPVQEASSSSNWCFSATTRYSFHGIKTDGTLWAAGNNAYQNRLGLSNGTVDYNCYSSPVQEYLSATNWCYVEQNASKGLGIRTDGTLWAWGCNAGAMVCYPTLLGCCLLITTQENHAGSSRSDWVKAWGAGGGIYGEGVSGLTATTKGFNEP